jgi:preprotein translocase SecF subunit/protein-export membrane protein SecD
MSKIKKLLAGKVLFILLAAAGLSYLNTVEDFSLGLDLKGGTQLDYVLDLSDVEEIDRDEIVEGTQEIIRKRVDSLGVAEPQIYISNVGDEYHIIVELAGIDDVEEAKDVVGKTIQLEFKEVNTEPSEDQVAWATIQAQEAYDTLASGVSFEEWTTIETEEWGDQVRTVSEVDISMNEMNPIDAEILANAEVGSLIGPLQGDDGYTFSASGQLQLLQGVSVFQVTNRFSEEETVETTESVSARHILIAYDESDASAKVERTQEEAQNLANELLVRIQNGESLADLAIEFSDDTSAETGGDLGNFERGQMVDAFEEASFNLEIGGISEVIETNYGYHIIEVYDRTEAGTEVGQVDYISYNKISYSTTPPEWKEEAALTGEHFKHADVNYNQAYQPYVSINFTDEGAELFEALTAANIGNPIAIFVGGELISAPTVQTAISGGQAQITGTYTLEEAQILARDLNTGAIPAPIELSGQYTISSSLGAEALNQSMQAGLIGLILLGLFMLVYYRIPGLLANLALVTYSVLMIFLLKFALPIWLALFIGVTVFGILVHLINKNDDSGGEKFISLLLSCIVLFFLIFVLSSPVTLTLAGIAGVILSIGMAVDANVLIFERMKEELRAGHDLHKSIDEGFKRAWDSIRDSNFSSLITCAILFYFGSSIIRGFALNLALGILLSMFSAIMLTRTFLHAAAETKLSKNLWLFGKAKNEKTFKLEIIKNSKIWAGISTLLLTSSIVVIALFGLNFGLDFTGGTMMELAPKTESATEVELTEDIPSLTTETTLEALEDTTEDTTEETNTEAQSDEQNSTFNPQTISDELIELGLELEADFGNPQVVTTDQNSVLIRIKHVSEEEHDAILNKLNSIYGELEEIRFTTVGPTIGETLKQKAIWALAITLFMIVIYIAFAFRKIPKEVSPWRFGLCAIAALVHDVLIVLGVFVILGYTMDVEIDALFITALLTIMGFSVHDTIVVFDRVRENLIFRKNDDNLEISTNRALNQTMARSLNTSISTLITIVALLLLGAESIKMFVLALTVGILAGTYSSIFVASPLLVWWNNRAKK